MILFLIKLYAWNNSFKKSSKFRYFGTALGRFSQFFNNFLSSANRGGWHFYSAPPHTPTIKKQASYSPEEALGAIVQMNVESITENFQNNRIFENHHHLHQSNKYWIWRLSKTSSNKHIASTTVILNLKWL